MNGTLIARLLRLLPAVWAGALLTVALIATPAPFALLPTADAGRVVGRILGQEAWLSLVLGATLLMMERGRARRSAEAGQGSVMSAELVLLLGTVFCTVAGYFGIQPLMPAARAGQGAFSFGQLHLASTVFYGIKLLLVMALAWRSTAPAVAINPGPSS